MIYYRYLLGVGLVETYCYLYYGNLMKRLNKSREWSEFGELCRTWYRDLLGVGLVVPITIEGWADIEVYFKHDKERDIEIYWMCIGLVDPTPSFTLRIYWRGLVVKYINEILRAWKTQKEYI